ncbi:2-hydroxyacid dehydrogenase [Oceanibacterium hippocampi]|uniref:Glyoxylate/hydroxypyruvate reductase A n=1 Tax=Oceanibacterium hippocampi TaxID=745714 RepID=A0A1Y5TU82_9PROT|nr:2-hydroxyacid dehydrogenase [Oceanibacterium hippocampi]SLN71846.1 Glyoxylate/hydroxypyruvate reductase A [Oceanibacterium hippocampi]
MIVTIHHMARADEADHFRRAEQLEASFDGQIRVFVIAAGATKRETETRYAASEVLITRKLAEATPVSEALRLLQVPAAGYDLIKAELLPPGAALCNLTGHGPAMAEFVMAAILEWSIGFSGIARSFRSGKWQHGSAVGAPPHRELFGRTISILGFGTVGAAIAARAKAFGMRVETLTRRRPSSASAVDLWHGPEALGPFTRNADFLVLACPLTEETRGIVDRSFLGTMKPTAVLLNLARAEVVQEKDLFDALQVGRIAGAVLDVWHRYPAVDDPEPRPSPFPFHELDNVIMTPHVAAWTDGVLERRWEGIARNLRNLLTDRPLENRISRGRLRNGDGTR